MKTNRSAHLSSVEELIIFSCTLALLILTAFTVLRLGEVNMKDATGHAVATVKVLPARESPCNLTLHQGWNMVSFYCISTVEIRDDVIQQIPSFGTVFEYQENSQDAWRSYNPNLPVLVVQDLASMTRTEGYWIFVSESGEADIRGSLRIPTNIALSQGWNLAGYPTNSTKTVNVSFATIAANMTEARKFDNVNKVFLSYRPSIGGGFVETQPYDAVWINATTGEVWTVD